MFKNLYRGSVRKSPESKSIQLPKQEDHSINYLTFDYDSNYFWELCEYSKILIVQKYLLRHSI